MHHRILDMPLLCSLNAVLRDVSNMTLLRSSSALLHEVWQQHEFTLPELHRSAIPLAPWGAQGLSCVAATHFRMDAWSIDSV